MGKNRIKTGIPITTNKTKANMLFPNFIFWSSVA